MRVPNRIPRVFHGWYVLAASFAILFLNTAARYLIGVMVKPISADFDWGRGATSSAIFLNMAVYALSAVVTGRLYDRYGPKWVIAGSAVLFSAGYALMGTMTSLWQFLLYFGVLNAAGLGGLTVPIFGSIICNWFEKWRGLAISLAFAGGALGQFFLIPVFSDLIDVSGWRTTCLWIAAISAVVNLALTLWVIRGDPRSYGLLPYGRLEPERRTAFVRAGGSENSEAASGTSTVATEPAAEWARGTTAGLAPDAPAGSAPGLAAAPGPAAARAIPAAGPTPIRPSLTLSQAMRTRSLWLFAFVMVVCGSADYLMTTHLVPLVTDHGISGETGAAMLAWAGLLSLVGVLLVGPAADLIGNKIPIALTFVLRVVLFLILLLFDGPIAYWVFALGFGLTLMVTAPLAATLVSDLYGVAHLGLISGFINTVHMLGGGLWAYAGGAIFDATGTYDLAFLISGATAAVALVCALFIREPSRSHRRRGLTARGSARDGIAGAGEQRGTGLRPGEMLQAERSSGLE